MSWLKLIVTGSLLTGPEEVLTVAGSAEPATSRGSASEYVPLTRWPVAVALGSVPGARADVITTVTKFNGTITDVGVVRGPGQIGGVEYRIKGYFEHPGPIDLSNSTLTIHQFFVEPDSSPGAGDGAGELMRQSQGFGGPETDPTLAPIDIPLRSGDLDEAKANEALQRAEAARAKAQDKQEIAAVEGELAMLAAQLAAIRKLRKK